MNAIIVGASGYSGLELIRILLNHPKIKITHLFVNSMDNRSILDIYPQLKSFIDLPIENISSLTKAKLEELNSDISVVFLATPSGVSKDLAPLFIANGFKVVDLSGDFRIKNPVLYEKWYNKSPADTNFLSKSVYGLAELFFDDIKSADYIANPGCYATSIILALAPLFKAKLKIKSVIIDAKSGVSGAGKGFNRNTHYSEVNENLKTYKVGIHQHIPEIEQTLELLSGNPITVQMMTHLIPMTRGILSTIYVDLENTYNYEEILALYNKLYNNQPFVRIRSRGEYPETKHVYGTNFCDIGLYVDERTNRLIIFSVIDNLLKGAAGQAVQNLNIMMNWEQDLGLKYIPIYP